MKQIIQNLKTGETILEEVPSPQVKSGCVLIQTTRSLVSLGTERMLVEFGQANLIAKARQQPEKVKMVLDKIKSDGLAPTIKAVFNKLGTPLPLGYCNVGVVDAVQSSRFKVQGPNLAQDAPADSVHSVNSVKEDATAFKPGDRVVSNGPHAEVVCVPERLCAKIPDEVSDDEASFAMLGVIGLQGIRLAQVNEGDRVVVFGLGLIGLLTVQILRAKGCKVFGVDVNKDRLKLAEQFGVTVFDASGGNDPVSAAVDWADSKGAHAVLITASAKKDDIVHQSAQMCRKHGKVVLIGVVDLNLRRSDFYDKELSFQVSCSYGPDRMKPIGPDNPGDWTVRDNLEIILGYMENGKLDVKPLITHRFRFDDAVKAYDLIREDRAALGVVLEYGEKSLTERTGDTEKQGSISHEGHKGHKVEDGDASSPQGVNIRSPLGSQERSAVVGVIGAGNFVKATLMPALVKTDARIKYVASQGGTSAAYVARKFGCDQAVSDYNAVLEDPEVNAVVIATRHDTHADLVCEALKAGKHVFVEKPLCLNEGELERIKKSLTEATPHQGEHGAGQATGTEGREGSSAIRNPYSPFVMVGFNRRFSPHTMKVKELIEGRYGPLCMNMTVNAGAIPKDHWVHDPIKGGGRIIGEGCHFIDLMLDIVAGSYSKGILQEGREEAGRVQGDISSARIVSVSAVAAGNKEDMMAITLKFADGSVGTINYFANGSKSYPKETLEVFSDERVLRVENFRVTRGYGFKGFKKLKTLRQDKGHADELKLFVDAVTSGYGSPVPFEQLVNVTRASLSAVESAQEQWVVIV